MDALLLTKIVCCVISAILAAAIVARDPRLRVNRILGLIPAATAFWTFCEVIWNTRADAETAATFMRLSSISWFLFGALVLDLFAELQGPSNQRLRRLRPWAYSAVAVTALLYIATPWGIEGAVKTSWGWAPDFGPLLLPVYATVLWPMIPVVWSLPTIYPRQGSRGEKRVTIAAAIALMMVAVWASVSELILPLAGVDAPRQGSLSLTAASLIVAWHLHRYGFSVLSPGAFAQEILGELRDGVALLHDDGRVRAANRALEGLVGVAAGELDGRSASEFLPMLGRDPLGFGLPLSAELCPGRGDPVPVSLTLCRLPALAGSEMSIWGDALIVTDLREVSALKGRLLTSAQLAAVGELSAGISQEINRPVTAVRAHLEGLRRRWCDLGQMSIEHEVDDALMELLAEGEELIEECFEGTDRVHRILRDVRGFAQSVPVERSETDVNRLIEGAVRVAEARRGSRVEIRTHPGEVPPLVCGEGEIEQVFINLLVNALQAVGSEGRVEIFSEVREGFLVVSVRDDGCGIPPEVAERIFDPFFTTKLVGKGTGLGLAICLRIVRSHGGEIHFESEPGQGTVFRVHLPIEAGRPGIDAGRRAG